MLIYAHVCFKASDGCCGLFSCSADSHALGKAVMSLCTLRMNAWLRRLELFYAALDLCSSYIH